MQGCQQKKNLFIKKNQESIIQYYLCLYFKLKDYCEIFTAFLSEETKRENAFKKNQKFHFKDHPDQ